MMRYPARVFKIFRLYRVLKGKYKVTMIFAHIYRESIYKKRDKKHIFNKNMMQEENQVLNNQKIIINIHDGVLRSGGLTDRLKGMCTLYMIAKKHNFQFKIYFVSPFKLEKYLSPNLYDWKIDEKQISYNYKKTATYTWENEELADVFFRLNKDKEQLHISCNSAESSKSYSNLFAELFKPSLYLSDILDFHLKELGGSSEYISISFRFQNLLGEFAEGRSVSLSKTRQKILVEKCLNAVEEIKDSHIDIEKVLITSDSNLFREAVKCKYPYIYTFIISEEIGHMDYSDAGKGKELTAFLDMFLISTARKAYQVKSAEMYNSDFPRMAAKINNVPYEVTLV